MLDWIVEHLSDIGVVVLLLIRVLEAYVATTETKADDLLVAKIKSAAAHFFGLTSHKK